MKKILLSISAIFLWTSIAMAQPAIKFKKTVHNFGTIKEDGGIVTCDFHFINNGNEPLVLTKARSTCGCTVPEFTKEPIAPGDSGVIHVKYNPKGRPGKFNKPVYIHSNAPEERTTLRIRGVADNGKPQREKYSYRIGQLSLRSLHLPLYDIPKSLVKTGTIAIRNEGTTEIMPDAAGLPAHITVDIIPPVLHPDEEGTIKISYDPKLVDDWGFRRDEFKLGFALEENEHFNTITVSANILDDFLSLSPEQRENAAHLSLDSDIVDFGTIPGTKMQKYALTITNTGKNPLKIHKVTNENKILKTTLKKESVKPGKSTQLIIEVDPSLSRSNLLNSRIILITNDPERPSLPVRVLATFE